MKKSLLLIVMCLGVSHVSLKAMDKDGRREKKKKQYKEQKKEQKEFQRELGAITQKKEKNDKECDRVLKILHEQFKEQDDLHNLKLNKLNEKVGELNKNPEINKDQIKFYLEQYKNEEEKRQKYYQELKEVLGEEGFRKYCLGKS